MNFASFLLPVVSSEGLLKKGNPGGGRGVLELGNPSRRKL